MKTWGIFPEKKIQETGFIAIPFNDISVKFIHVAFMDISDFTHLSLNFFTKS